MSTSLREVNGVEYRLQPVTIDPVANRTIHLLVPEKVDGLLLEGFLLLNHARSSPDPEREAHSAFALASAYYLSRYRYLLRERKFDLMSLSSDIPNINELRRTHEPELSENEVINNLCRLVKWGESSEPTPVLLHKALYIRPEWFPVAESPEDVDEVLEKLLDGFSSEFTRQVAETTDPLEQVLRKTVDKLLGVFLYYADRVLFSVYGEQMQIVYRRVESELAPSERELFKKFFFPNPAYLNRIPALEASPVPQGFYKMVQTIERAVPTNELYKRLTPDLWGQIWRAYLAFYPCWANSVRQAERERERKARKTGRSVPLDEKSEGHIEEGAKPDYMVGPWFSAKLHRGELQGARLKKAKTRKESRKKKTTTSRKAKAPRIQLFLSKLERTVMTLAEQGVSQKDIAERLGYSSPSAVTKIKQKTSEQLRLNWEIVWKDLVDKYQRKVREYRRKIPVEDQPAFFQSRQVLLKLFIEHATDGTERDRKRLEKELLSPWRPR